jgi:hypothetical protein
LKHLAVTLPTETEAVEQVVVAALAEMQMPTMLAAALRGAIFQVGLARH